MKTTLSNKEKRAYRKMHRRHRKELVRFAKKVKEWDYAYLHEMVVMQIKHMYEYYLAGNNVWQSEEDRTRTIESLKRVLTLEEEFTMETLADPLQEALYYENFYAEVGKNILWWWD